MFETIYSKALILLFDLYFILLFYKHTNHARPSHRRLAPRPALSHGPGTHHRAAGFSRLAVADGTGPGN